MLPIAPDGGAWQKTTCKQRGFTEFEDDCGGTVDLEQIYFFEPEACEARVSFVDDAAG